MTTSVGKPGALATVAKTSAVARAHLLRRSAATVAREATPRARRRTGSIAALGARGVSATSGPRHVARASSEPVDVTPPAAKGPTKETLITAGFITLWYAVNVAFNL